MAAERPVQRAGWWRHAQAGCVVLVLWMSLGVLSCSPAGGDCEAEPGLHRIPMPAEALRAQSCPAMGEQEGDASPAQAEAAKPLLEEAGASAHAVLRLGVDVLLEQRIELLQDKRVGLVTNASGVDGRGHSTADRFASDGRFRLLRLYAPEHGLRGTAAAGESIGDELDAATGVPVQGLYGGRSAPSAQSLAELDVLVFDIQDIGSRTYTYISTLGKVMEACAASNTPLLVLDRPNPLGGELIEGPIREQRFKSFVGWAPIPVVHGMSIGELARFYNGELELGAQLEVVPMQGWRREMLWPQTGLDWVPTSPNIPHAHNAWLYVATGMVAGVSENVNEGCGYTMPFETIAAEFIDAAEFARELSALQLPGVRFRPLAYRPFSGKFRKTNVFGVQLLPAQGLRPLHTALQLLVTMQRLYPGRFEPTSRKHFARIWGNERVLEMIRAGKDVETIEASWRDELEAFRLTRAPYLLYD